MIKMTIFLIMLGLMQSLAGSSYSQNARLDLKMNASLEAILGTIEDQTDFHFFYRSEEIDTKQKLDVDIRNSTVFEILDNMLPKANLSYQVFDKYIAISPSGDHSAAVSGPSGGQQQKVTGKVTDPSGAPLPGVTVIVKGTTLGAVTDVNGHYMLANIKGDAILVFSFIGMKTQEIPVAGKSVMNVVLEEETVAIEEVVAVGYGTMRKSDLTGSVASVSSEQISQILSTTVEQTLTGRASGVQVTQSEGAPGAGVKIRVRGGTSINASNEPLYVIDGFPLDAATNAVSAGFSGISGTSVLATMNPNDIASIEVLKDASATAIYGSRGANGVVLITTKSGGGVRQNISFNAWHGISTPAKTMDVLEGDDYIDYFYAAVSGTLSGVFKYDYAARDANGDPVVIGTDPGGNQLYEVWPASKFLEHDWQDEIFRNATVQDYNLSFSGGTKKMDYLVSAGYFNQEGIILGSNYERYTGNFKLNSNFSEKFSIGANINTGYSINDGIISATSYGKTGAGVINNMIYFRPVFGYNEEGKQIDVMDNDRDYELTNPVKLATRQKNLSKNYYMRSNINLTYKLLPGLSLTVKGGVNLTNGKQKSWYPGDFGYGKQLGGGLAVLISNNGLSWLNENLLAYKKTIGNHKIDAVFGFSRQRTTSESFGLAKKNFEIQSINLDNIGSGTDFYENNSQSAYESWTMQSWLGRINYTFKEKYLFTVTGRDDACSRFAEGNKWAFFPSGALAWRVSQEPFFQGIRAVNDLKLHASYGVSGNLGIESYASLAQYNFVGYAYQEQLSRGLRATRLQNNDLTWETTRQLDLGMDLNLFDSRVSMNAVYYKKLTDDLLLEARVPYTSGFSDAWKNTGSIENYGMEFSVNTVNIEKKNFSWRSNFNISFNRNKVKKLNSDLDHFYVKGPGANDLSDSYIVQEGKPIGSMFGYIWEGAYQLDEFTYLAGKTDAELRKLAPAQGGYSLDSEGITITGVTRVLPGMMKFRDIAGAPDTDGNPTGPDGKIDSNDRTIIGDATPKHYGGFSNDFTFRNFDLSILLNWSYGNDIYNKNLVENMMMQTPYHNQLSRTLDKWTPENPTNALWGVAGGFAYSSTAWIEDGSFLRLSNVTLGYNLPKELIAKWNVSNARIYVSGDNLHVWTSYSGFDPEVSVGLASSANPEYALTPGIDFGAYPRARTFRVGIKIDF
ncbi:MAG: TonB-dependent receptor [Mangrovibacterium sp.]|nr:TonB-dependent receptor [Mangrovibacterium sp.]